MSQVNVHVRLSIDGCQVEGALPVPVEPSPRRALLPVLQRLADTITQIAEQSSAAPVSCRKGCDACCRQMVPISPAEAYAIAALIDTLPPEHAATLMERFDAAHEKLDAAGLLDRLSQRHQLSPDHQRQLDRDYFTLGIPCPFLEDHACSIHPDRPLACREFLVTSPAAHCANPTADRVTPLPLSAKLSVALTAHDQAPWLPLTLARTFIAKNPELPTSQPPAQELQKILQSL